MVVCPVLCKIKRPYFWRTIIKQITHCGQKQTRHTTSEDNMVAGHYVTLDGTCVFHVNEGTKSWVH